MKFGLGYTEVLNKESLETDEMNYFVSVFVGGAIVDAVTVAIKNKLIV